jgi:dihydrofolate reductase
MRRLRYGVAASLDGFIADRAGGYDWLTDDPAIDFGALFAEFDLFVMGRKTFEVALAQGDQNPLKGMKVIVASTTMRQADYPEVQVVNSAIEDVVRQCKVRPGKDIWLYGGGTLARTLFDAQLVDTVEIGLMPILLGGGIPMLPEGAAVKLSLMSARSMPSGIQMLDYSVIQPGTAAT